MSRQEPEENALKTWQLVKNVIVVSFAFMVQYTAFNGAVNLQSSINAEAGLGMASLAAMYVGVLFSSTFLPVVVIKWLGTKWTITIMFFGYMPYMLAQLRPSFYTLVPAGVLVGLVGAPAWCAMCTYVTAVAKAHSKISNIPSEPLIIRFLGMFFMVFHLNQVWGNLISSLVLTSGHNEAAVTSLNASLIPEVCGARFLPSADGGETLKTQPYEKIQMLVGVYIACMAGAIFIVVVGVDSMKKFAPKLDVEPSGRELMMATLKLLFEPKQLLLIVISIFLGLQQSFVGADFTAAYVSCSIGTGTVGFVMLVHGVADATGCAVTGYLAKLTGRVPLICGALVVNSATHVTMLLWRPQADMAYVLFLLAIALGVCNSVWLVQINAYYGILFPGREEPAFSNFRLFEGIGFVITYTISPYIRITTKTYVLFAAMVIGSVGYFVVEYKESRAKKTLVIENVKKVSNGCDNVAFDAEL